MKPAPDQPRPALTLLVAVELWAHGRGPSYAPMAATRPGDASASRYDTSWSEYGVKEGIWRLLDLLRSHRMSATVGMSGMVTERYPGVVDAVHRAGHEIAAHSWSEDATPATSGRDTEDSDIQRCTDAFHAATGVRPTGWISPMASGSADTADLLTEHGYVWCGDNADRDLPTVQHTGTGRLVQMTHSDYSDVRDGRDPHAFLALHRSLVDCLVAGSPRGVGTISLHAHVGGRPLLAHFVDRLLDYVDERREMVRVVTCDEIARAALARHKVTTVNGGPR